MATELIYETIVTSVDVNGKVHIAPFGVRERDDLVLIAPFRPSASLDNFLTTKSAVINLVDDVRIFAGAFVDRRDWPMHPTGHVRGFFLDAALSHRELELVDVRGDEARPELYFKVVYEENHAPFRGFNRAQLAVVELAVLVSRLHMLPMEKIETEITYLEIAITKTAGPRELEAWSWLIDKVSQYKSQLQGGELA